MFITFFRSVAVVVIVVICSACNILFLIANRRSKQEMLIKTIRKDSNFTFYTFFFLSGSHIYRCAQDIQHSVCHDDCNNNCLHFLSDLYSKITNACTTRSLRNHSNGFNDITNLSTIS